MKGLRQNGFARGPRWRHLGRLRHGPFVVSVRATKQRNNKSSINEYVSGHNEWRANILFLVVRSVGKPSTDPMRSAMESREDDAGDRDIQGQHYSRVESFLTRTRSRFPEQQRTFSR